MGVIYLVVGDRDEGKCFNGMSFKISWRIYRINNINSISIDAER